ncbi:MAG: hypothetical protein U5L45_27025 [Saprospiraceae bacterium]|nr:hypothetical protein [Saprospiraceae bacterium]
MRSTVTVYNSLISRNYLAHSSLHSQKGECGSFFGLCPKTNHLSSLARAKRARD